ncbi:inositol monophosphatase family protein [Roseomonas marmotae]|uniref:Inositol monophosphatase n=1 Tax=Roseomonas marmotae TaxID=2768161 RepID=A0ABS3KFP1_9PROT|nr:inositol monophosphatase family protein [Roseomonas marmotae]MBO1075797.1 inositol monophosphatase [Roseomonas marmotae]QTI80521.1 inositol monophosphatase [Roseomonas marmotae]
MQKTTEYTPEFLLTLAGDAARCTRDILVASRDRESAPLTQLGRDIKLAEDGASEARIRSLLAERADLPVLGEEQGWGSGGEAEGLHWVVDPLDGSFNFYRGIPLYAVSIALCRGREPVLGAIYDPERDELMTGGPGLGLFLNGAPLAPPQAPRQILATGFPSYADPDVVCARLAGQTRDWKKIRMLGSAALSLAWVAMGRLDGYAETNIMWWDVAAGLALARGAGLTEITFTALDENAVDILVSR